LLIEAIFSSSKKNFPWSASYFGGKRTEKINKELAFEEASLLFFHLFKTI
jgi:hypothetical protein